MVIISTKNYFRETIKFFGYVLFENFHSKSHLTDCMSRMYYSKTVLGYLLYMTVT